MFTYIQTGNEAKQNSKVFVESNPLAARVGRWDDHVAPPQISSNNPSASSAHIPDQIFSGARNRHRRHHPAGADGRTGNHLGPYLRPTARIIDLVEDKARVGVSLDTCHALAAGCDFRTTELKETVGIDCVDRGHFNLRPSQQPVAEAKADRPEQSRKEDPIRP